MVDAARFFEIISERMIPDDLGRDAPPEVLESLRCFSNACRKLYGEEAPERFIAFLERMVPLHLGDGVEEFLVGLLTAARTLRGGVVS